MPAYRSKVIIDRRVVVTGFGIVSSLGLEIKEVFNSVLSKRPGGISALVGNDWKDLSCRVAGVVKDKDLLNEFTKTDIKEKSRPILLGVAAARRALSHSGYVANEDTSHRCGVCVGMGMPDLKEISEAGQSLAIKGPRALSPYFMPRNLVNMAAGHISIEANFQGPNLSVSTACTTGLHAIGEAYRLIQHGTADVMLCGGTEAPISPLAIAGFSRMRALCTDSNDSPETASRPFDSSRAGFVMSEGAAVLVLEDREHALCRGATIFAELRGYGLSGDAYHMSAPTEDGVGAFRCMSDALRDAQLTSNDISYVNAHATSTPLGDAAESRAIDRLFGDNRRAVNVSSVKGAFGHLLGAAGSLEAALTCLACYHARLPPTCNLNTPDTPGRFQHVTQANQVWEEDDRLAITNSFGFGGTNASLCIANHEM